MKRPRHADALREFTRAVLGDVRELHRNLRGDPDGQIAIEEIGHFLIETAQELRAGARPQQPAGPGMSLAALGQRAPEAPTQTPEERPSDVAALLQKMNGA
jgi:hypothetical protein